MRIKTRRNQVKPLLDLKMARFFSSKSRRRNLSPNINMFCQDLSQSIIPFRRQLSGSIPIAKLTGNKEDQDRALDIIKELGNKEGYDISEDIRYAIENIAPNLVWTGKSFFEIVKLDDCYYFSSFTSKRLFKFLFWYIQILPKSDTQPDQKRVNIIATSQVWKVSIPKSLGGSLNYQIALNRLQRFRDVAPDFYIDSMSSNSLISDFDISDYNLTLEMYIKRATKVYGWNRRDYSSRTSTEFYTFYKMLMFAKTQAHLREHLVSEINSLLKRLSISSTVILENLTSSEDLEEAILSLKKGEISFSEVNDIIFEKRTE